MVFKERRWPWRAAWPNVVILEEICQANPGRSVFAQNAPGHLIGVPRNVITWVAQHLVRAPYRLAPQTFLDEFVLDARPAEVVVATRRAHRANVSAHWAVDPRQQHEAGNCLLLPLGLPFGHEGATLCGTSDVLVVVVGILGIGVGGIPVRHWHRQGSPWDDVGASTTIAPFATWGETRTGSCSR